MSAIAASAATDATSHHPHRTVVQSYKQPPASARLWHDDGLTDDATAATVTMGFTVLLRQRNTEDLKKLAEEVSDPSSPRYGHFMSVEELGAMVNPPKADQARALAWVQSVMQLPAAQVVNRGDSIRVDGATVGSVGKLFGCTMHRFTELPPSVVPSVPNLQQASEQQPQQAAAFIPRVIHRCVSDVTVPSDLADVVAGALGVADFPKQWRGGPHPHPGGHPLPPRTRFAAHEQAHGQDKEAASKQEAKPDQQKHQSVQTQAFDDTSDINLPATHERSTPIAHPHRTLRHPDQLRTVAMQFERELGEREHGL